MEKEGIANMKNELLQYSHDLLEVKIIRWEELPDFGVYSDQVLSIIEKELSFLDFGPDERIITPAMINNYVKLKLIERPTKKKYEKHQIAMLIVITLLKQVLPLTDVNKGMELQIAIKGLQEAYDSFCTELENSFYLLNNCIGTKDDFSFTMEHIHKENIALKMITLSLASKLLTQKIITMEGINKRKALELDLKDATKKGESSFEE